MAGRVYANGYRCRGEKEVRLKQVAAAIAIRNGFVLVARRGPGEKLEGHWEFPGGKLESGETPQDCIVREMAEELGIPATAGEVIAQSVYEYPSGAINLIAVHVTLHKTDFRLTVHDVFEWASPADLLGMNLAPADVPIAEEIERRYG